MFPGQTAYPSLGIDEVDRLSDTSELSSREIDPESRPKVDEADIS
jgi:hypothetical protein